MDYKEISIRLTDRWGEVLSMYGIEVMQMKGKNSKNGPCPLCGGDDRAHWRNVSGRLALFCRSCAAGSMKSPESVIMELCGIDFPELYRNLLDFVSGQSSDEVKRAVIAAADSHSSCGCPDHKYDPVRANELIGTLTMSKSNSYLLSLSAQPLFDVFEFNGKPCFPMRDVRGNLLNVVALNNEYDNSAMADCGNYIVGVTQEAVNKAIDRSNHTITRRQFLDSIPMWKTAQMYGICYDSWFTIQSTHGESDVVYWCSSVVAAIKHSYMYGCEVRVTFSIYAIKWMIEKELLDRSNTVLTLSSEEEALCSSERINRLPVIQRIDKSITDKLSQCGIHF